MFPGTTLLLRVLGPEAEEALGGLEALASLLLGVNPCPVAPARRLEVGAR